MEAALRIAYFTLFFAGFASSGVLPVDKCNLEDSACLQSAFQKSLPIFIAGLPDIGIEVLDPLKMDDVTFSLSGLDFTLKSGTIAGLKSAIFDKTTIDMTKKVMTVVFHFDGELKGDYIASGQLLILPIQGDGKFTLKMKNTKLVFNIMYDVDSKNDKTYVVPKKMDFEYEIIDKATFGLTNLFNGNKELSDNMHTFLNNDWKTVSVEFGKPLVQEAAKKIYKNIQRFFKEQAIEDIATI